MTRVATPSRGLSTIIVRNELDGSAVVLRTGVDGMSGLLWRSVRGDIELLECEEDSAASPWLPWSLCSTSSGRVVWQSHAGCPPRAAAHTRDTETVLGSPQSSCQRFCVLQFTAHRLRLRMRVSNVGAGADVLPVSLSFGAQEYIKGTVSTAALRRAPGTPSWRSLLLSARQRGRSRGVAGDRSTPGVGAEGDETRDGGDVSHARTILGCVPPDSSRVLESEWRVEEICKGLPKLPPKL